VNPQNRTQVLVDFAAVDATDNAVGGNVDDNAVFAANADGTPATTNGGVTPAPGNQHDEEGVANTSTIPAQTPGRTADPDLVSVTLSQRADQFGNLQEFRATYTFDEAVQTAPTASEFSLYLADGTILLGSVCTTAPTTSGANQNNTTVTCTEFDGVATGTTNGAQSARIGSATLGTVDNLAVRALDNGDTNPEGAERTTGGTGTPRA
jgi:hypothetical protein